MIRLSSRLTFCSVLVLLFFTPSSAQVITIPIETRHNAMVLQVSKDQELSMLYYGKKLSADNQYASISKLYNQGRDKSGMFDAAYTAAGSHNLLEPAIAVTHADGNQSLGLQYVSHHITKVDANVSLLTILLKDPVYDFELTLTTRSITRKIFLNSGVLSGITKSIMLHSVNLHRQTCTCMGTAFG